MTATTVERSIPSAFPSWVWLKPGLLLMTVSTPN